MTTTEAATESYAGRLEQALPVVRGQIAEAAHAADRDPGSVRLVAVTKGHPLEAIDAALGAGLTDLGENRVHELEEKVAARGAAGVTWHMIGHVQSRKAKRVVELADIIHSVDSESLAGKLSRIGVEVGREVVGLAQVNTSGEGSKGGFDSGAAVEQIHRIAELPGLKIAGLMTMAPFVDDEHVIAAAFAGLRQILERLRGATDAVGPELSMGMTNDLEIAIREGSTMVRIGTALFGPRA